MSGSSLDGVDIAMAELQEVSGKWNYTIRAADCYPYTDDWAEKLATASGLSAVDYLLLHTAYGHHIGALVNRFIEEHQLHYKVQLIASHGHTTIHIPAKQTTAQLGDGAAIAAVTGINVVSDLRAMDLALGGHGAPIVPIAEKLLLGDYGFFLNIGGIANLSFNDPERYIAFDICPANRVLNMLAHDGGKAFDENGRMAKSGNTDANLLRLLNDLEYYGLPYPKSLSNDFGTDVVYPLVTGEVNAVHDALRTYTEHIAMQVASAVAPLKDKASNRKMLVTGGGAHNGFLIERIRSLLAPLQIEVVVPDRGLIDFKEALAMALIGVLRWREENNVLGSVTGAARNSIGGAVWMGQEA